MIEFHHISLRYPTGHEALHDISFVIPQGSFYFITGPSGAGKSSILRLIYRSVAPTKGDVIVAGYNLKQLSYKQLPFLRRKIGIVFQDYKLLYDRSVYDNIALALEVSGYPSKKIKDRVKQTLEYVGLSDQIDQKPIALSGGEQQRAAIARAIVNQPPLIIADEPTGNLDKTMGRHIFALFDALHRQGSTVLIVTHDTDLVEETRYPYLSMRNGSMEQIPLSAQLKQS